MNRPIVLRPEAEEDVLSAWDWYERQKAGMGDKFAVQVSVAFDQIATMPELFAIHWQDVRACRLRRFPYVVYYRALADRVEVLAVLHGSRDSSVWHSRA